MSLSSAHAAGPGRGPDCPARYNESYQSTWRLDRKSWDSRCAQGAAAEDVLRAAQSDFIAACQRRFAGKPPSNPTNAGTLLAYCARGTEGEASLAQLLEPPVKADPAARSPARRFAALPLIAKAAKMARTQWTSDACVCRFESEFNNLAGRDTNSVYFFSKAKQSSAEVLFVDADAPQLNLPSRLPKGRDCIDHDPPVSMNRALAIAKENGFPNGPKLRITMKLTYVGEGDFSSADYIWSHLPELRGKTLWLVISYPTREAYFVDAQTGQVVHVQRGDIFV